MTTFVTALSVVNDAGALMGEYDPSEAMEAGVAQSFLRRLNDMLDSWSANTGIQFNIEQDSFVLTAGKNSYTIGPSGDFVTQRPVDIRYMWTRINNVDYFMSEMGPEEWAGIYYKPAQSIPEKYYFNSGMPNSTINIWPTPVSGYTLFVGFPQDMSQFALASTLAFPQGYQRMIVYNLAKEAAPLVGREVSPTVAAIAAEAKYIVTRANIKQSQMRTDVGTIGSRSYNWLSDATR